MRGDVILLHHGLGSVRAWKDQIPPLVEAGWRVLVYDRWGYGKSDARPALDLPGFETDMRDLEALLANLEIVRAALIGHSDGGTLALYYAARHPEQVSALVSVAAHIYVEPSMIPGLEGVRLAFETDPRLRQGLRRLHGDGFERVFHNWADGWSRPEHLAWDMRPVLQTIACPALVIQGERDEHATPQHARDLAAALPRGRLWLVPEAGHMTPQEAAREFNREVLAFLGADREP